MLARDLALARGTITEAYAQLAAEGYISLRPGASARVAANAVAPPAPTPREPATEAPARFGLAVGVPDLAAFPRAAWVAALRRALAAAPQESLDLPDPRGRPELRAALAGHLRWTRGVVADADRIVVCSGFAHGFALVCSVLRDAGVLDVAMEDPCLQQHRMIARGAGLRVAPIAVDDRGAVIDLPRGLRAVIVTPAHQFPLGGTLAPDRRTALVAWARAHGAIVVEDDYDGEYRYDHHPVGALQGLDPDRVVYAGTTSKTLAPGLRVGWLVLPAGLVAPVLAAKAAAGADSSSLEQLALAEFLQSGAYDRHVRRMRQRYRRRRDLLLARLAAHAPRTRGIAAGLHVVVELPPGASEAEVVARARARGLAIDALGTCWHDPAGRTQGLILGYAAPPDHAYARTLDLLADVLV